MEPSDCCFTRKNTDVVSREVETTEEDGWEHSVITWNLKCRVCGREWKETTYKTTNLKFLNQRAESEL